MGRKILMVTMGMDIGGAETHIIELSRELHSRGWDVIIASNGGVYVEEIEAFGMRHVQMPINDKKPAHMLKSYKSLKKLIKEEQPDIVHAHARIPAFITGLVRRSVEFNFVTTAHWVFKVTPLNRKLTDWGSRTVAVSEDIRQYLIDEYSLDPNQISVTINGIDTNRFSPDNDCSEFMKEMELDPEYPVITYVSRMDESRALAARHLIAVVPKVAEKIKGLQVLIVGGGDVYDELLKKADAVNEALGRKCIIMPGARTDIDKAVAAGDMFIGVSRAALEAMSAAKPVIIAGNEGYLGIYDESKLPMGIQTNFCCRGCEMSDEDKLYNDIMELFTTSQSELRALGEFGRKTVMEHYSVRRMADDYCEVYDKTLQRTVKVLMSGYFGFNNAGDEEILRCTYENIKAIDVPTDVEALIYKPEDHVGKYEFGMVDRFKLFKVMKAVKRCDVLISGGGSILQDRTSKKSIWYYLLIIRYAEIKKRKVVIYANGIGPVRSKMNRKFVRRAVERADLVTLRDEHSAQELKNMGVENVPLHVTADTVFSGDHIMPSKEMTAAVMEKYGIPSGRPYAVVSLREWEYSSEGLDRSAAEICNHIYNAYGLNIVFVAMQNPNDVGISRTASGFMTAPSYVLDEDLGLEELMSVVGNAEFVICMRLHTLIFAANMGVPSLGIIYDPKIRDYLDILGMPGLGYADSFSTGYAIRRVDELNEHYDDYKSSIRAMARRLQRRSKKNIELLSEVLEKLI